MDNIQIIGKSLSIEIQKIWNASYSFLLNLGDESLSSGGALKDLMSYIHNETH